MKIQKIYKYMGEIDNKIMKLQKNKSKNFKEKYYICQNCGALNTETQILGEVSGGSCGMCYCEFDNGRILNKYKRINKELWEELNVLKTDKLKLKRYLKDKINKTKRKL